MRDHRQDIQGLRAVAVLTVMAFHAGLPLPGGFVGVDVFFVISGFVIAGMLNRQRVKAGRIRLTQFYMRRFKRLIPALATVVAFAVLFSAWLLSPLGPQQTAVKTGIGAMLLCANIVIAKTTGGYFDADAHLNPLLHTWSLSVEEQFYLMFPGLIASGWYIAERRTKYKTLPWVVVTVVALISFGLTCGGMALINAIGMPSLWSGTYGRWTQSLLGFYSPVTRSWEFAAGVLLALFAERIVTLPKRSRDVCSMGGLVMLLASFWLISPTTPFPSAWTLLPVLGAGLLIAGGLGGSNVIVDLLSTRGFVKFGDWSYSLYLWHWPLIVFAGIIWPHNRWAILGAAAASVGPAVASYHWIENPIRNMQLSNGRRLFRVTAYTLAVPLLLAASINFAASNGYWSNNIRSMQAAVLQPHVITTSRCAVSNLVSGGPNSGCTFNQGAGGRPMYLIGDSTAWHFSEAAVGAAELLGRPLTIINTSAGCPVKNVYVRFENAPSYRDARACRQGYEAVMRWLESQAPGTVIISDVNGTYHSADHSAVGATADSVTSDGALRVQVLDDGLSSTIRELQKAEHAVLLVSPAPDYEFPRTFDPLQCSWHVLVAGDCFGSMPRRIADSIQQPQRDSLQRIAHLTGAHVWDPRDFFCSEEECGTNRFGLNLYRDAFHISPDASRRLAASLAAALKASE